MLNLNKDMCLVNRFGECKSYCAEEILSQRLNNWKGWRCSAGVDNIHISPDGNIFSATCKVGGLLGNVYDDHFILPRVWLECTKDWCMCGADMQLLKARNLNFVELATKEPPLESNIEEIRPDWIVPYHFDAYKLFPKNVTWDLGRRCNYSCDYCHPSVSNNYEAHKSWGSLKHAADRIFEHFAWDKKVKFVFTGGEPTINPAFADLVDYLFQKGHLVHIQSNGSRLGRYYADLIPKSCIGLSAHLKFVNVEKFVESVTNVVEVKRNDEKAALYWFGVRIMVPPGEFDKAKRLYNRLSEIPHFSDHAALHMSPLYQRIKQDQMMKYSKEEYEQIMQHC